MRTLFFYYKYPFFIEGSYFQEFINKFAQENDTVCLVATHYPKRGREKNKNIIFFWLPLLNIEILGELFFIISAFFKVVFNNELHKVDVANTIGPRGLLAGWYLRKRYRIPLVCTIEIINEKGNWLESLSYWFEKFLITKIPADKYICWSTYYWENHLQKWGIPRSKVEMIPGGIDVDNYRTLYNSERSRKIKKRYALNKKLIVFAKPLYSDNTKSAKLLVKAFALLKSRARLRLLIGGGKGQATVTRLADKLGIGRLVSFMPPTPFKKIPNYIGAADLVVLPFVYAPTISRSLLEAMVMGKPIIATRAGEIEKILINEKSVVFVEPKAKLIAKAIEKVISDDILSEKIGRNAFFVVKKRFDLDGLVKRTKEVLQRLLFSQ